MRWRRGRRSSNIEDRRGQRVGRRGGGIPIRIGRGKGGVLATVALVLVAMYFGIDPSVFLGGGSGPVTTTQAPRQITPQEQQLADFVSVVLADTEDTWQQIFQQRDRPYEEPTLVLFSDAVNSACGFASAAIGPFYCTLDQKVYIDLGFYNELKQRFGAPGDFAQAYVIAHEVGHHVQNLLGISEEVMNARARMSKADGNELSVRMELQADCMAGLWARRADQQRDIIEPGDIQEALNAAAAIGDDRLQQRSGGAVVPDSFTHGTSEQRMRWFKKGWDKGQLSACDTFNVSAL